MILITGANGFLGPWLINTFVKIGSPVVAASRQFGVTQHSGKTSQKLGSLTNGYDQEFWERHLKNGTTIFLLSWNTGLRQSEQDERKYEIENLQPLRSLVSAVKLNNFDKLRVVFFSSVTVYGDKTVNLIDENVTPNPVSNYDLVKLKAEKLLSNSQKIGLFHTTILRLTNIYGLSYKDSQNSDRQIIQQVIDRSILGKNITLYGHGEYHRDYLYIEDLCSCLQHIVEYQTNYKSNDNVFNLGYGRSLTIKSAFKIIAQEVESKTKKIVEIHHTTNPNPHRLDTRSFFCNTKKIQETFLWSPRYSFKNGIRKMLKSRFE